MDVQSLGYRTDLAIRRAEGAVVTDCGDHVVVRTEQNPGYWWGNFILLSQPPRAGDLPDWLDRFEALFPAARHRTFGVDVTDPAAAGQQVFAAESFPAEVSAVLTATSLESARQPGLVVAVRQLAGDDDWRQSAGLRIACEQHDEPAPAAGGDGTADAVSSASAMAAAEAEFTVRKVAARRRLTETGRAAWFGAFANRRLVAQLGLVPTGDGMARYQDVETHPRYRRNGLAGAVICRAARYGADELGITRLVIVTDPGYHAIGLYTSLGFRQAEYQVGFERV